MAKASEKRKVQPKVTQRAERAEQARVPVSHAGAKFSDRHHVFIAKLKRGELWALNHLRPVEKANITPLFEMWPPSIPRAPKVKEGQKPKPAKPPKTLTQHSADLFAIVRDEWRDLPFFLDTQYVPKGGIPTASAVKTIFDAARNLNLPVVPVTALRFTSAFQAEIAQVIQADKRGVLVRLHAEDFTTPPMLPNYLAALQTILGVAPAEMDLLIDLRQRVTQSEVNHLGTAFLSQIPNPTAWRTLTLAAGAFPSSITDWGFGSWIPTSRVDWLGWQDARLSRVGQRQASYGDYGVRCGGAPLSAARRPDPNVRYTSEKQIITRKGDKKKDGQIKLICADLLTRPEYSGQGFSRGDLEIAQRAVAPGSPNNGQAEQWIQWCTNHHLALTAAQLKKVT